MIRRAAVLLASFVGSALAANVPHFTAPEVLKLDWNTRCPRSADFNGDGRMDLALINVDRARIEILVQGEKGVELGKPLATSNTDVWNPVLELSRFSKHPLVESSSVFSLVTGDFNGDGRADLAYTTDEPKLRVRFHGKDMADWTLKRDWDLDTASAESESLLAHDMNADGRLDLVLVTEAQLRVYLQGSAAGNWLEPQIYALTSKELSTIRAADLNGDGRQDLYSAVADAAHVRLQTESGSFGEEWRLPLANAQCIAHAMKVGTSKAHALAWIQDNTGMVELSQVKALPVERTDAVGTVLQGLPPSEVKTGTSLFGDVTGEGVPDVIIAEPKRARVWVFQGRKEGGFMEGREFPSLSGVESMQLVDLDQDQKMELLLFSPQEKTLGRAQWTGERLNYPEIFYQSEDNLMAMTAGVMTVGQAPVVVCISDSKPKLKLFSLRLAAGKTESTALEWPATAPSKVNGMQLLDVNHDQQGDLLFFSGVAAAQLWLSCPGKPLQRVEGLPDSLMSKLSPVAVRQVDLQGDGKTELLVTKDNLARAFEISAEGKAKVVDQLNAPSATAELNAALVMADKKALLLDTKAGQLHVLKAEKDGVYRAQRSIEIDAASVESVHLLQHGADQRLLLLGKQNFQLVPLAGMALGLERLAAFTTELKDTEPVDLIPAPFSGGSGDDIMLIDTQKSRVAEFFRAADDGGHSWQSCLYFRIFQNDPNYRGKAGFDYEPHDYAAFDVNADGKPDLCLLVHDRLLLYVQR